MKLCKQCTVGPVCAHRVELGRLKFPLIWLARQSVRNYAPQACSMTGKETALVDVTLLGPRTKMRGVQAAQIESRPWLEGFPVCQTLRQYQMLHLGIEETRAPMRIVRTKQTSTYFLACIGGEGRVLIDGSWRICREGYACLLPAHTLNAF